MVTGGSILVHLEDPYRDSGHDVKLLASARVSDLITDLVNVLSYPVMLNDSPLVYHLYSEDGKSLEPTHSLSANGITANGRTLTIKHDIPIEVPLFHRLKAQHSLSITWNCFRTGGFCDQVLSWNPTRISVLLSSEQEEKSDKLYDHGIEPAVRSLQLVPNRVKIQGLSNEPASEHQPHQDNDNWCVPTINELCVICRSGLQDLLSIVDITGRDPLVLLTLGLLWGHGQPVILTHRRGAFAQIPTDGLPAVSYEDPGEPGFKSDLQRTFQKMTGVREVDLEGCKRCGKVIAAKSKMIVCLGCRSRYHQECWSGRCRKCRKTSYIRL